MTIKKIRLACRYIGLPFILIFRPENRVMSLNTKKNIFQILVMAGYSSVYIASNLPMIYSFFFVVFYQAYDSLSFSPIQLPTRSREVRTRGQKFETESSRASTAFSFVLWHGVSDPTCALKANACPARRTTAGAVITAQGKLSVRGRRWQPLCVWIVFRTSDFLVTSAPNAT